MLHEIILTFALAEIIASLPRTITSLRAVQPSKDLAAIETTLLGSSMYIIGQLVNEPSPIVFTPLGIDW